MSIATEITRLQNAKAAIKTAIEGKGVAVPDATLFDGMAALIDAIEAGGGGSVEPFSEVLTGTVTFASASTTWTLPKADNLFGMVFIETNAWGEDSQTTTFVHDQMIFHGAFLAPQIFRKYWSEIKYGTASAVTGYDSDYSSPKYEYGNLTLSGTTLTMAGSKAKYFCGTYWYALIFGSKG